jgi:HD-like signal output (HDOD) protein
MDNRPVLEVLEEQVSRGTVRVPPYPATALRLQTVLAREYDVKELVEAMRTDPVFSGNLLRLANSALYRRGLEVTSIGAAVARVGSRELTRLAMASAMGQVASGAGALRPLRQRVWRQSVASALISETLARRSGGDPAEAFVAGLLHDVGKLMVLAAIEDLQQRGPSSESPATWEALVERCHVRLGGLLAERWQLPGVLGAVILTHHEPIQTAGPLTLTVIHADAVVALLEQHPAVDEAMLLELGLEVDDVRAVLEIIPSVPAFMASLEVREDGAPPRLTLTPDQDLSITGGRLTVKAQLALELERLVEVELLPEGFTFWAVVEQRTALGEVVLRPFALGAQTARAWAEVAPS